MAGAAARQGVPTMTNLPRIIAYLEKDLEDRRARGEKCPWCKGAGYFFNFAASFSDGEACCHCNGSGKSPAITEAEEMLALAREEGERVARLRALCCESLGTAGSRLARKVLRGLDQPPVSLTEESIILARELVYAAPKKHWKRYAGLRKELDEYLFAVIDGQPAEYNAPVPVEETTK